MDSRDRHWRGCIGGCSYGGSYVRLGLQQRGQTAKRHHCKTEGQHKRIRQHVEKDFSGCRGASSPNGCSEGYLYILCQSAWCKHERGLLGHVGQGICAECGHQDLRQPDEHRYGQPRPFHTEAKGTS